MSISFPGPGTRATRRSCSRTPWPRWCSPTSWASTTPGRSSTTSWRNIPTPPRPRCSSSACAALTKNIRVGHGIRQVIPNYNHPARVAEGLATLDIISNGRVEFGIGEGATRLELGAFHIPAREKRAMAHRGGRADRQHDDDGSLPRLRGQDLVLPLPQRRAQAGAEARIRRCGWPAPTATRSRSRPRSASARWPSPSSIRTRPSAGPTSTTGSSSRRSACRSATR